VTNLKIVFEGDSITDACRNNDPDFHLGYGYPLYLKALLSERYPDASLEIFNRGVSGDVIRGLERRWTQDCLSLKPDLISILIGVNDTGFSEDSPTLGTVEEEKRYEHIYRHLLEQLSPEQKIVLMEPFVLPSNENRAYFRPDLDRKIKVVRQLAQDYDATLVTLDGPLNEAVINHQWQDVTRDGVHPAPLGNLIIAQRWMKAVTPIIDKQLSDLS
jgi:lysophospholipase L1-like esterase